VSNIIYASKSSDQRSISRACEPKAKPKIGRSRDQTDPAQRDPQGDAGGALRHQFDPVSNAKAARFIWLR
jgi:hypothetical protein